MVSTPTSSYSLHMLLPAPLSMIDLAQCPECGQFVRVPHACRKGRFRCPECEAEFDDSSIECTAVPELIPLTADGEVKVTNLEETQRMPHVVEQPQVESVLPQELASVSRPRPALRRRPKKKMSWEVAKIALGGIAGLMIAQLILWWLPGSWRRDPFRLADQIPAPLQFVLPKELRAKPSVDVPSLAASDSLLDAPDDGPDAPALDDLPPMADEPNQEYQPSYSASELQSALIAIGRLLQDQGALETQDRDVRRARFRELYQKLCDVAQVVTYANVEDREVGKMMRTTEKLLTRVSGSAELMELVRWAAADWIRFPSRNSDGVALAGEVVGIYAVGNRYDVQIKLPGRNGPIVHVVREIDPALDPRHAFHVGEQIIVLGSILSDPQARSSRVQYGIHLVIRTGA